MSAWARDESPDPTRCPSIETMQLVREMGMGPMAYCRPGAGETWEGMKDRFKMDYASALARGTRALNAGVGLCGTLKNAGMACIGFRGPFAGARWYGDVALRPFVDLDVLVSPRDADRALDVLESAGWVRRYAGVSRGFQRRHHIHWALRHDHDNWLCDVHWALDHPYRLYRIDYAELLGEVREAHYAGSICTDLSPEAGFLCACVQVEKERRALRDVSLAGMGTGVFKWIDLYRIARMGGADWGRVKEMARRWSIEPIVGGALDSMTRMGLGEGVDEAIAAFKDCGAQRRLFVSQKGAGSALAQRIGSRAGFRPQAVGDIGPYLFPERRYFGEGQRGLRLWWRRCAHCLRGMGKVTRLGLDVLGVEAVACWKMARGSVARMLLFTLLGLSTVATADDYGNGPQTAHRLVSGAGALSGTIHPDTDKDWFRFVAMPSVAYTVTVSRGTIWNTTLDLNDPVSWGALNATNSAWGASPLRVAFTNTGTLAGYFVEIGGLFEFTTGTYSVAVSGGFVDTDNDGMHDPWEMAMFGSLAQGANGDWDADGKTNLDEYYSGTSPVDSESVLRISRIAPIEGGWVIEWPGVARGTYEVQFFDELDEGVWKFCSSVGVESSGLQQMQEAGSSMGVRLYRVRLVCPD